MTTHVVPVTVPVYRMDRVSIVDLLVSMYNITEYDAESWIGEETLYHGRHNGENIVVDVAKADFGDYETWLKESSPEVNGEYDFCDGGYDVILCDAANKSLIPEGIYILSTF